MKRAFFFVCTGTLNYTLSVEAETPEEAWLKVQNGNFKANTTWERDCDTAERCIDGICEEFECEAGGWYTWDEGHGRVEVETRPELEIDPDLQLEDRVHEPCISCLTEGEPCPEHQPDACPTFYEPGGCKCPDPTPTGRLNTDGTITYLLACTEVRSKAAVVTLPASATEADIKQAMRDEKIAWTYNKAFRHYQTKNPDTHEIVYKDVVAPVRRTEED